MTVMKCCICTRTESRVGVLCDDCREALLIGSVPITREQIRAADGPLSDAALVDAWGITHRLCYDTTIGRAMDPMLFAIYDSSISRTHARIASGETGWTVQDLASANGTFIGNQNAVAPLPLTTGTLLRIGFIRFYFVEDASMLSLPPGFEAMPQTVRPSSPLQPALREVTFKLSEPSGGGAGVVEIGGIPVHLTLAQYELVSRLVARMVSTENEPADGRGFITSEELAGVLSLESLRPDDDNVRQLVRRVRKALLKAGVGDVIETKYGMGYRLSVTPRVL